MPERSVSDAFYEFLRRQVPTQTERDAATSHRASVKGALEPLDIYGMWETGSFHHGTAVRGHCDVDVFASLKGARPASPDTALGRVKNALVARFPNSNIRISRPAVVINFAGGNERWEVIPAYFKDSMGGVAVYDIPAPGGLWMESSPSAHLQYVNEQNADPQGGAKSLARLVKAWKYLNFDNFKVSSFYLEMRAAKYMSGETYFDPAQDFVRLMERLASSELASMNDPTGASRRFNATSTENNRQDGLRRVRGDAASARAALDLEKAGSRAEAFDRLDTVFMYKFPSRWY